MTPLSAKRILVTRPRAQAGAFIDQLTALGAIPVIFPTIILAPPEDHTTLDRAIHNLSAYQWLIFTSANGVAAFFQRLEALGKSNAEFSRTKIAAIGPATARALQEFGLHADFVPDEHVAEAVAAGIGDVSGQNILLPRADIARKALAEELSRRGAHPQDIAVYRTLPYHPGPDEILALEQGIDVATFTSSSTLQCFLDLLGKRGLEILTGAVLACIGPITAETARAHGLRVDVVAGEYTTGGLIRALVDYCQSHP
jgi:uroporphyrinogen III methyltransferase/synthase